MNNVQKEILDAIDIIVDKKMKQYSTQILFGVVESVGNDNSCIVSVNTIGYNIRYYGNIAPIVKKKYPVFVPSSGMSNAFIITDYALSGSSTSMAIDNSTLKTTEDGVIFVNTANAVEPDNTLPVTSAAVYTTNGNIEVLLETI